jgi:excisionase family DNA binding protein
MEAVLERTTRKEQKLAQSSIEKVGALKAASGDREAVKIKLQEKGEVLEIPKKAFSLLITILKNMAEGKSITLLPSDSQVSTQQAADLLKVSRPHLVKLLEQGEIPFRKAGTHRRIELKDLLTYEEKLKKARREKLNFLAKQAQELNLGY